MCNSAPMLSGFQTALTGRVACNLIKPHPLQPYGKNLLMHCSHPRSKPSAQMLHTSAHGLTQATQRHTQGPVASTHTAQPLC